MLAEFLSFIKTKNLFQPEEKILLAVSGGKDSVAMAELFYRAGFNFSIAHCNFQLRGKESDGDEKFVKQLAKKYGIKFFSKRFETKKYAGEKKISTQMAARDLRYAWFEEIRLKEKFQFVATAHHLNDSIETFFINILRGTGIAGLSGISEKNNSIIRPMLFASGEEMEKFTRENKLAFREDSSNQTDDYLRNKIRHQLIPVFKNLNPQFEQIMSSNFSNFSFTEKIIDHYRLLLTKKFLKQEKKYSAVSISAIRKSFDPVQNLFLVLHPFGFNFKQCNEMLRENASTSSGKIFIAKKYRAVRDREKILIEGVRENHEESFLIPKTKSQVKTEFFTCNFSFRSVGKKFIMPRPTAAEWLDAGLLKFPLTLRKWKAGDYFYPLGMKHKKKLSDFFTDLKINLFEKENIYVLTSENQIVCILGHRIDDRFKITTKTKTIYKVETKN